MLFNCFCNFCNCFYIETKLDLNYDKVEFNLGARTEPNFKAWFILSLFVFTFSIELAPFDN